MLPVLAMLAFQAPIQRMEGLAPDLESLGFAVAVVRDPEQREHVELALSAPRSLDGFHGEVYFLDLASRASVARAGPELTHGWDLDWLGDVDLDGWPDFLLHGRKLVWTVWSSRTQSAIWQTTLELGAGNTSACTIGDVDLDRVPELVPLRSSADDYGRVQADSHARLAVWSGRSGRTLRDFLLPAGVRYERRPVAVGDLDGDRWSEVALFATRTYDAQASRNEVEIWSSEAGHCLARWAVGGWTSFAESRGEYGTDTAVGVLDDLDGNGTAELLVPGLEHDGSASDSRVSIEARDALTGRRAWRAEPFASSAGFQCFATGGADLDGDGIGDALLGQRIDPLMKTRPSGRLRIVSGCDGRLIREHVGAVYGFASFPQCAEFVSDLDGDGVDDYLATETCGAFDTIGAREKVRVFSGRTGAELLRFP